MNFLRKGMATVLCVSMLFSLNGMALANETAYAETEAKSLENAISLNAGKGTVSQDFVTLEEDGTLPELPAPVRTGWDFVGWYTAEVTENYWGDEEGETLARLQKQHPEWDLETCKKRTFTWIIESEGTLVSTGDTPDEGVTELYAMYKPTTVTVVWHYNGWQNQDGIILTGHPEYDSPLTPVVLNTDKLQWEGRTFLGWYDAPEGGTKWEFYQMNDYLISSNEQVLKGDLDLYAYWEGGPEAEALRLTPVSQHVEPGSEVTILATYTPNDVNKPKVTWTSDSELVTVKSVDDLKVTLQVSSDADVDNGNKIVTVTAQTEQGVTAEATITIGHTWNNGTVIQWPSCTEGGFVRYTCTECGVTKDVSHPADGHRFISKEVPPTCTAEGYEERYCIVCRLVEREVDAEALGHTWNITTITSCTGIVTTYTCEICGLTEVKNDVNPAGHEWESFPTVDKEPTCAAEGSQSYHCKKCDATRDSSVIPADSSLHQWSDWEVTVEAAETEGGEETRVCDICGAKEKRSTLPTGPITPNPTPDPTPTPNPDPAPTPDPEPTPDSTVDVKPVIPETVSERKAAENTILKAVQKLMNSSEAADRSLAEAILAAERDGMSVSAEFEITLIDAPENADKFKALFDGTIAQYVEIDIVVKAEGKILGHIMETEDAITFSVELPETEGKVVSVIREHEGVVEFIPCWVEENTVYFTTDKFSTFAVGLTDDDSETGSGTETGTGTETGSETETDTRTETDSDTKADAGEETKSENETDTDVKTVNETDANVKTEGENGSDVKSANVNSPKTGDETNILLYAALLGMSGGVFGLTLKRKRKISE